jgi:hypothetical protein
VRSSRSVASIGRRCLASRREAAASWTSAGTAEIAGSVEIVPTAQVPRGGILAPAGVLDAGPIIEFSLVNRSWRIGASLCDRKDGEHSCPSSMHKRRRRRRLPPAGNSDSALDCPGCGGRIGVAWRERRHVQSVALGVHGSRPDTRLHRSAAASTVRVGRCLEISVVSARRCGVRRGRVSRGVDVNDVTGTGRDVGAQRVINASPEWAARLRDAQARANARRIASSDAAVTAWVRALMRDRRDRDDASAAADLRRA